MRLEIMQKSYVQLRFFTVSIFIGLLAACAERNTENPTYDLVILGGRVLDPETGLDAVLNIGIEGKRITAITDEPLTGETIISAYGKVVSPGFIDLHSHAFTPLSQRYQVHDGVTTVLELEGGRFPIDSLLHGLPGGTVPNIGASAGYISIRIAKFGIKDFRTRVATPAERAELMAMLNHALDQGGLGVGLALDYISEAVNDEELAAIFEIAGERDVPVFVHLRRGINGDPEGLYQVLELAKRFGASLHVCHITHNAMRNIELFLAEIRQARADGVDVTAELLPYPAGSTGIASAVFFRDWQTIFDIGPEDVQWSETGEFFTSLEMFEDYQKRYPNGVITHHYVDEAWNERAFVEPGMIIVSDMIAMHDISKKVAPHNGAFSRTLGRYGREKGLLPLMDVISKMTLLPAKRLEGFAPIFARKGRLQVGMDADITVFDWNTVLDRSNYEDPYQPSAGIEHVIVNGTPVISDGSFVENTFVGEMLYASR